MLRNLILMLLIVWLFIAVRRVWRRYQLAQRARSASTAEVDAQHMRVCAHCGIYVPNNEALSFKQQFFCCEKHRQLAMHHDDNE